MKANRGGAGTPPSTHSLKMENINTPSSPTGNHQHANPNSAPSTFASTVSKKPPATLEQGIIIQAKEGLYINDYLEALIHLVDPNDIRYASKISNQRVCIFLSNKEVAANLTAHHKSIKVQEHTLPLRPLTNNLQKIIISNACPIIPNEAIVNALSKLGIKLETDIRELRVGSQNPLLAHVLSFRRHFSIKPEDLSKVPDSILLTHTDTSYRIFLASESITCFVCKQKGHLAKQCPDNIEDNNISAPSQVNHSNFPRINTPAAPSPLESTTSVTGINNKPESATITEANEPADMGNHSRNENTHTNQANTHKRPRTSSTTSSTRTINPNLNAFDMESTSSMLAPSTPTPTPLKKQLKTENQPTIRNTTKNNQLEEFIPKILANPGKYKLNFEQFDSFVDNCRGSDNVLKIALEYTPDTENLIQMIIDARASLTTKSGCKLSLTKLVKKLKKQANITDGYLSSRTNSNESLTSDNGVTCPETT